MRFAKSTGCFYPESEDYTDLPEDIIDVPHEDFEAAMSRAPGETLDVVDGRVVVMPKPPVTGEQAETTALLDIDAAADAAYTRLAGSAGRVAEYERAYAEAVAFKDAGYTGAAGPAVVAWAEAKGWSSQQATDDIIAAKVAFDSALYGIRNIRLKGKEAVRSAAGVDAKTAAAAAACEQLKAVYMAP